MFSKIKHLKVPTVNVENVKVNDKNNLETLFQNTDGSIELAMGSEAEGTPSSRRSLSTTTGEEPTTETWSLGGRLGTPRPERPNDKFVAEGDAASDCGN